MSARIWIVGTSQDCDLWVEGEHVAQRHLRLTEQTGGFLVEDLRSATGTYVNGERLGKPRLVRHGQRVTLGPDTPLPWLKLPLVLRIGRAPDNDFVVARDSVSGHHARIERIADLTYLVDLASTNGTALNSPVNRISRASLTARDDVFLGTHRVAASELLAALEWLQSAAASESTETAPPAAIATAQAATASSVAPRRSWREWAIGFALSALVAALILGGARWLGGPD